ncbi:hypothetical protein AVDCRST_MAG94-2280 [uncultured Leptolyngbya sp.]|jgi:hypothetical protein|uniref:Uncharacterized protein n=1 Tax=uncultured Leptolyngbya sp. TaxID=332963 RepID=A0A6J4LR62_9CYAN|nr:hypothetical protein AVDCRST_MAG94-2280 [uncultured Leptolyngbya sp.]
MKLEAGKILLKQLQCPSFANEQQGEGNFCFVKLIQT